MVGSYEIRQGTGVVGRVTVERQGLYYRFSCRCHLTGEIMHRLSVMIGGEATDLGVCVPMDGTFGVEKRLPCKKFPDGIPEFRLVPHHEKMEGKFVPIYPEEPFAYLARLKNAFLAYREGQAGIVICE